MPSEGSLQGEVTSSSCGQIMEPISSELRRYSRRPSKVWMMSTLRTLWQGITWTCNPPPWSHYGSIWEIHIRAVRRVLGAVLHKQTLDEEGLQTLFCEIESIINSSTKIFSDVNNLEPLTPNHLLLLDTKPVLPPGVFLSQRSVTQDADGDRCNIWQTWFGRGGQESTCLNYRSAKSGLKGGRTGDIVGDIVLIVDDTTTCNCWIIGRITQTLPDSKGVVRQVSLTD